MLILIEILLIKYKIPHFVLDTFHFEHIYHLDFLLIFSLLLIFEILLNQYLLPTINI